MLRNKVLKGSILGAAIAPALALAQVGTGLNNLQTLVQTFGVIVRTLLPIVFALAILAFFYGIMLYVFSQSTDTKREGRGIMLWALVAIFVMASLFGIVLLAQQTLGINNTTNLQAPTVSGF
jgi:hypothetical protein